MSDLATRLREARLKKGMTARALSKSAGLASAHVALIESRRRTTVAGDTLDKLARVLDVSIDWLVTGSVSEHGAPASLPPNAA